MDPVERCDHDIDELLSLRADGRASPERTAMLERQLAACPSCRARAALLDWAADGTRQLPLPLPPDLADEVMRRVRGSAAAPQAVSRRATLLWLPAAAALAVGLGAFILHRSGSHRGGAATAPEDAQAVGVELALADPRAGSVAVAGDFTGWDAVAMEKGDDGVFRVRLSMARGRYQYAFLVDGTRWIPDPKAASTVESGYGGEDSVLDLTS